jgi:hypothetical protein
MALSPPKSTLRPSRTLPPGNKRSGRTRKIPKTRAGKGRGVEKYQFLSAGNQSSDKFQHAAVRNDQFLTKNISSGVPNKSFDRPALCRKSQNCSFPNRKKQIQPSNDPPKP